MEHLSKEEIIAYSKDQLPQQQLLKMSRHLGACSKCNETLFRVSPRHGDILLARVSDSIKAVTAPQRVSYFNWRIPFNWQIAAGAGLVLLMLSGVTTFIFLRRENSEFASNLKNTDINTDSEKAMTAAQPSPTVAVAEDSGSADSKTEDRRGETAKIADNSSEAANSDDKPNSESGNRRLATETKLPRPETQSKKNTVDSGQSIAGNMKNLRFPASLNRVMRREILTLKGAAVETEFDVIAPTRTFLRDASPTFVWQAVPNAVRYEIAVRELKGSQTIINESTTTTSYKSPPGRFDPHRGKVLQWSVTAYLPDNTSVSAPSGTEPEALFLILDKKKADGVENNLRAAGEDHLTKAVMLAKDGLLEDAKNELQIFLKLHPRSKKARTLLKQIRSRQETKKITTPNR